MLADWWSGDATCGWRRQIWIIGRQHTSNRKGGGAVGLRERPGRGDKGYQEGAAGKAARFVTLTRVDMLLD